MVVFLTSILYTHHYDDNGRRIPIAFDDKNSILLNIRKNLKSANRLVVVANDPNDALDNDDKLETVRESFGLAGVDFKESVMLDGRNGNAASEVISRADIVILTGGKCVRQKEFFGEIGLKEILKNYDGIVIGVSAGSMNLGKIVANFPEETADLGEPRWLEGMGFVDEIIIPHYDGKTDSYEFPSDDFDIAKDYILPMSDGREFIGMPNGSYIIVDRDGRKSYYGDMYKISNGKSERL